MSELDAYDYELPRDLIAQYPLPQRADARLLVVRRADGTLDDRHVRDLPELLREGDLLVLNDTRVVPARLVGARENTLGRWSGLFLETDEQGVWRVLSKTRGKLRPDERIWLVDREGRRAGTLWMLAPLPGGVWAARPEWEQAPRSPIDATWELLDRVGRVPLPPYIRGGEMADIDERRYQTVFAERPGAVAAPTAGLHFTPALLDDLRRIGVQLARVTLHVGLGTFRPMQVERLDEHVMHSEWCELGVEASEAIAACKRRGGRVVAVGTTVVRVLETAALRSELAPWRGATDLFIRPPFSFRATDALLTNFHLPRSTLLVLVRTFGGDSLVRRAYSHAIEEQYRFFSYGDAMLIE